MTTYRVFDVIRIVGGVLISLGLGWLVVHGLQWGLVVKSLGDISPRLLVLAMAVFLFATWVRALRFHTLFGLNDLSIGRLFIVQHEGLGFSNLMPLRVAGEILQLAVLRTRDGVSAPRAMATLAMDRLIDLLASILILAVGILFLPEIKSFNMFVWGVFAFTIFSILIVLFFIYGEKMNQIQRFSFLATFAGALADLKREKRRLLVSFLLSIAYWLLVGITAWFLSISNDLGISLLTVTIVIMSTIFFATVIPAAPSAIGTFEFAVVYLLEFFGIERSTSFGFAIIVHAVFFLPSTIIAAIFLPREGVLAIRAGGVKVGK